MIFTINGFFPTNSFGGAESELKHWNQALPLLTMILSLFSSAFGMAKFFLVGPVPILSKRYPLNGMLSLPFVNLVFLNLMFGVRIICIEHGFFTSYVQQGLDSTCRKSIDPVIPTEFRLLAYFIPCLVSFIINVGKLTWSTRSMGPYLLKYPQFLLAPCFTPFMFEPYKDCGNNYEYKLRVWKKGTLANAFYLGCLPQCVLVAMEYYKGVPSFYFDCDGEDVALFNEALFKFNMQYGGIGFALLSSIVFSFLIFRMFCTDSIFKNQSTICKPIHILCCPYPQNCFTDTVVEPTKIEKGLALAVNDETKQWSSLRHSSNTTVRENRTDSSEPVNLTASQEQQGTKHFCD